MELKESVSRLNEYFSANNNAIYFTEAWNVIRKELEGNPKNSAEKTQPCGENNSDMKQLLSCPECNCNNVRQTGLTLNCLTCNWIWEK